MKWAILLNLVVLMFIGFPYMLKAEEIDRDGRYIAYENGTVLDSKSGLMWAAKDNGDDIAWEDAIEFCENYDGGGHTDWRMPTEKELEGLYNRETQNQQGFYITRLIELTQASVWTSQKKGGLIVTFHFILGDQSSFSKYLSPSSSYNQRALPVREIKKRSSRPRRRRTPSKKPLPE